MWHVSICFRNPDVSVEEEPFQAAHTEDKYIVFKSQLWKLFEKCPVCSGPCHINDSTVGTMLTIRQTCSNTRCHHHHEPNLWTSQLKKPGVSVGNLLLSAAILFAGASTAKVLRVLQFMHIAATSESTVSAISLIRPLKNKVI